ncbi:MAG: T9SS type A sorting domain-containing protein [Microscillaceae bacterium]|nr:T9SS type A sorting domain-containing protein [Microscillaceae bacterium]
MKTYLLIGFVIAGWLPCLVWGQIRDDAFQPNITSPGIITNLKLQPDGKLIAVGRFLSINGALANNIARFNTDGSLDTDFMTRVGNGANASIRTIDIQQDGKILLGGDFAFFNNVVVNRVVRLLPNGDMDLDFTNKIGLAANFPVNAIVVQPNQDILIAGRFNTFNGINVNLIVRLKPDGSIDNEFLDNTMNGIRANQQVYAILIVDNKIIIGGAFTRFIKENVRRITCLNMNGTINEDFNTKLGAGCTDNVFTLTYQPQNNMILVGGLFTRFNNRNANRSFRLLIDGSRDNAFTPPNAAVIQTIAITTDNKILYGGVIGSQSTLFAKQIAYLNNDGTLPSEFNTNLGTGADDRVNSIITDNNNNIWVGGDFENFNGNILSVVKLKPDGTLDNAYPKNVFLRRMAVFSLVEQNNQMVIAGEVGRVGGKPVNRLFRLNKDGTLDESFVNNIGSGTNDNITKLLVLQNGDILVIGEFDLYKGQAVPRLFCLNADGTLNTTFMSNFGINHQIQSLQAIAQQVDGKILLGGLIIFNNNLAYQDIVRLNPNGTLDASFALAPNAGSGGSDGFNGEVRSINLLSDGGIIVGGEFTDFNGTPANRIIRLTSNAQVASNFITLGADNFVVQALVQENDKILLGGTFNSFNGVEKFRLARITSVGALDNNFQFALTPNTIDGINNLNLQTIGGEQKILIAGAFTALSGSSRYLVRLNENGTPDESFNIAGAVNLDALVLAFVMKDNSIIVAGDFPGSIIRLLTPPAPSTPSNLRVSTLFGDKIDLTWTSENENTFYQIQRSNSANTGFVTIFTTEPGQKQYTDEDITINRQYFYRVRAISVGNASVYSNVVGIIVSPLITGDNSTILAQKLKVFPNPSSEELNLDFSEISPNFTQDLTFEIYTPSGQLWQKIANAKTLTTKVKFNLSKLPTGVYFLKINHPTQVIIKKIIKN